MFLRKSAYFFKATSFLCKLITLVFILQSCAFVNALRGRPSNPSSSHVLYHMTDATGQFILERESGGNPKKNNQIVKRRVYVEGKSDKELEKSIAVAEIGFLEGADGKKTPVLRPKISEYTVWFDSKKYFTQMRLDTATRSIMVKMVSPEAKWNGKVKVPFPKGTGVYCFFSQMLECIAKTGFFAISSDKNAGQLNFHIIWDGYPYFQEQYSNVPSEVFSRAQAVYDGRTEDGERKYTVLFGEESIFFNIDEYENLSKMFWISQGLTISRNQSGTVKKIKTKTKKPSRMSKKETFGNAEQFEGPEGDDEAAAEEESIE